MARLRTLGESTAQMLAATRIVSAYSLGSARAARAHDRRVVREQLGHVEAGGQLHAAVVKGAQVARELLDVLGELLRVQRASS